MHRKRNIIKIKPTPLEGVALKTTLSISVILVPILLAVLVDVRCIALLPACIMPLVYVIYRITYLDRCSIEIDYAERVVCIKKRSVVRRIPMDEVSWSARKTGVRSESFIIQITAASKTLMRLRDDSWDNTKAFSLLCHNDGKAEMDCIKRWM